MSVGSKKKSYKYNFSNYFITDYILNATKSISLFFIITHSINILKPFIPIKAFRILKLAHFVGDSKSPFEALARSKTKILVFMFSVFILFVIFGAIIYIVKDLGSAFTRVLCKLYWCIVTITKVVCGVLSPENPLRQFISYTIMILVHGNICLLYTSPSPRD